MRLILGQAGFLLADMAPDYFALVMSTGIVSLACHLLGFRYLAAPLFWLTAGCYLTLWLLFLTRLFFYRHAMLSDFRTPSRGVGFLTMVAGTCILGTQFVLMLDSPGFAAGLLCLGAALWLFFIYGLLTAFVIQGEKPAWSASISGSWLLATVSSQSISILACLVSPQFPHYRELLLLASFCLFLLGGLFYGLIIPLILYRLIFLPLTPRDFTPPYWINMGALAISALAGSTLMANSQSPGFLGQAFHFLLGVTVFCWAIATWWVPFLLILEAWRHLIGRVGFAYNHQYWELVFPLGMYTVCTMHLADILYLPWLLEIPGAFIYLALTAWFLTFMGLVRSLVRSLGSRPGISVR